MPGRPQPERPCGIFYHLLMPSAPCRFDNHACAAFRCVVQPAGALVGRCRTLDQAKAVVTFLDAASGAWCSPGAGCFGGWQWVAETSMGQSWEQLRGQVRQEQSWEWRQGQAGCGRRAGVVQGCRGLIPLAPAPLASLAPLAHLTLTNCTLSHLPLQKRRCAPLLP